MAESFGFWWSVFLVMGRGFESAEGVDYCKFSSDHVLCGYPHFKEECGDPPDIQVQRVTEKQKREILRFHNEYRHLVAGGLATARDGRSFYSASNMQEMVWDEELANTAEAFARKCTEQHSCQKCIQIDRFDFVGENIHRVLSLNPPRWRNVINAWGNNEAQYFDVDYVKRFSYALNKYGYGMQQIGHLSQVIWGETKRVGCAAISFQKLWETTLSICHYAPGGNFENEPVYKIGAPCSECPRGKGCSRTYPNLCAAGYIKPPRLSPPTERTKWKNTFKFPSVSEEENELIPTRVSEQKNLSKEKTRTPEKTVSKEKSPTSEKTVSKETPTSEKTVSEHKNRKSKATVSEKKNRKSENTVSEEPNIVRQAPGPQESTAMAETADHSSGKSCSGEEMVLLLGLLGTLVFV